MTSIYRPSTIEDAPHIIELLTRVFGTGPDAPFVNPALLRWKYWEPRADCSEPRSYVIEKAGQIVAHAGLWPVTVSKGAERRRGVHMIDWAADSQMPGAGVSLLQRLTKSYDFVYSIGGSEMTETILPRFGFRVAAAASTFARPLRPWRQALHHQHRDARLPLRLARNLWWSKAPVRARMERWAACEIAADDSGGLAAMAGEREGTFLRYLEQCPMIRLFRFQVREDHRPAGFFVLAAGRRQTRLAAAYLEVPTPEGWRAVHQLAQDAARRHTGTAELAGRTADETSALAAVQAGMRLRGQTRVFLFSKGPHGERPPLDFQMWDSDSVFLDRGDFLT
jgi:hypothetical protein